jgi:putative RecB family exonuclease
MNYYNKKPRKKPNDFLALGTGVHSAMEKIYEFATGGGEKKPLTKEQREEITKIYYDVVAKESLDSLDVLEKGLSIVIQEMDRFDSTEKVLGLELIFGMFGARDVYTDDGIPMCGAIDKVLELNKSTVVVIDYKTSKYALTQPEADNDIQLSLYDLVISKLYPQYENVLLVLDYLILGEVTSYRTTTRRNTFEKYLLSIYEQIENMRERDAVPKLNKFCSWCDYKAYCPAYKKIVADPELIVPDFSNLSAEEIIKEWTILKSKKSLIEARDREAKMLVTERINRSGAVDDGNTVLDIKQRSRLSYRAEGLIKKIDIEDLAPMIRINKSAADDYIRRNPEKERIFNEAANVSFSAPYINLTRKSK